MRDVLVEVSMNIYIGVELENHKTRFTISTPLHKTGRVHASMFCYTSSSFIASRPRRILQRCIHAVTPMVFREGPIASDEVGMFGALRSQKALKCGLLYKGIGS
jgi:hypothetical protein